MRHELCIEGEAFSLRPVEVPDSDFIAKLRNDPRLRRFIHPGASDAESQRAWIESYFTRPNDYYFIIADREGAPEGTVAIYDVDPLRSVAEWGRWVLRPGSLAAVESALLTYRIGFERLKLENMYCRTVAANESVVSFHDSAGLARGPRLASHVTLGNRSFDSIEHRAARREWPAIESNLAPLARRVAIRRTRAP